MSLLDQLQKGKRLTADYMYDLLYGIANGDLSTTNNNLPLWRGYDVADHVMTGCVWSADSAGVNRNASMTAGIVCISGQVVSVDAVANRTFDASKDTYVDVDNTGTLYYTPVNNNAASPALTTGRMRIAIIVTGASSIASAASVNQGQEDRLLPIASSSAYSVTDSLGNLICNRSPNKTVIGYRQFTTGDSTNPTGTYKIPQLSTLVVQTDGLRKIKLTAYVDFGQRTSASDTNAQVYIKESSTIISLSVGRLAGTSGNLNRSGVVATAITTPSAGSHIYDTYCELAVGGNMTINAYRCFILAELV